MKWLFKEEPTHYPYDEFVADTRTVWGRCPQPGRPETPALGQQG